ncbi:hypothetical protein [Actinomadura chokoriensis]|uniref:hypothetical protein n=1 Tax=Actinomadura chokoriensis TaxID=454156 RepID=UPI0031F7D541
MEDQMDTAPGAPQQPIGLSALGESLGALGEPVAMDQPTLAAVPVLQLTPVRDPWAGALRVAVTGAAVLVITAELGRRAGAPGRLTAVCSAGACAAVVGPWLASQYAPHSAPRYAAQSVLQIA